MTKLLTRPGIGQTANLWTTIRQLVDRFGATAGHTHAGQAGEGPTLANAAIALTWTAWTPTVTQSVSVAATITRARYATTGKVCRMQANLRLTAAGTAANTIVIGGLPVTLADATNNPCVGAFMGNDAATITYAGSVQAISTTTLALRCNASTNLLGVDPAWTLANGDDISIDVTGEVA